MRLRLLWETQQLDEWHTPLFQKEVSSFFCRRLYTSTYVYVMVGVCVHYINRAWSLTAAFFLNLILSSRLHYQIQMAITFLFLKIQPTYCYQIIIRVSLYRITQFPWDVTKVWSFRIASHMVLKFVWLHGKTNQTFERNGNWVIVPIMILTHFWTFCFLY